MVRDDNLFSSKQATQTTQDELLKKTTRVEGSILQAVVSTSDSLRDDIKALEEQLSNVSLDSTQQIVAQFTASHHDLFKHLSNRLDMILAMHTDFRAFSDDNQAAEARQSILDSLHFPQIRERRDQITKAYSETYRWILEEHQGESQRWDDFLSWLKTSSSEHRIYWVHGKIGAGKTTMLRFLDENLSTAKHMLPWAEKTSVVRASCFFWNAGNNLQKSTAGLLRTLLTQLFEQTPDLISRVIQPNKWQAARLPGTHVIDWTESELQDCLREHILHLVKSKRVFLLLDGLDEFDGTDEAREDLVDFLVALSHHENVKICLSSRPWNIFQDAFGRFPQLKLEDLTYNDIRLYTRAQLYGNRRFQSLVEYDTRAAEDLIRDLIGKAAGVFLWVRLVIKELLQGLRDGDGYRVLSKRLEELPADLDTYFMRLMDSIEPRYRKEASRFLQLALYHEDEFVTLHSNYLIDFSFVEEENPSFALDNGYNFAELNFADERAVAFRLESTIRKLNSRCVGLLECYHSDYEFLRMCRFDEDDDGSDEFALPLIFSSNKVNMPLDAPKLLDGSSVFTIAYSTVDFLHRSLRDFLLTPVTQNLLHQYTQGPYDARMFFRNARLVQLVALNHSQVGLEATIGLASYLLSTLTVSGYRDTSSAAAVATKIQPIIENIVRFRRTRGISGWYVTVALQSWEDEDSTFLTLAIDFGLDSYVRTHLTPQAVRNKKGRPVLDYLLRPRFPRWTSITCVGHHLPNLDLINTVLGFGADPNQIYQGISVWTLFLCFVADTLGVEESDGWFVEEGAYLDVMKTMLMNGADVVIPTAWLSDAAYYQASEGEDFIDEEPSERFWRRFQRMLPTVQPDPNHKTFFVVSDLLNCFRDRFGTALDSVKLLAMQRESISRLPRESYYERLS